MKLNEIFYSIQGEGSNTGRGCIFIRCAGCNLKCVYCDTDHSCKMDLSPQDIAIETDKYPKEAMVVITGGEPFLQKEELRHLIECLLMRERFIAVETNGTIYDKECLKNIDWVTVSPKKQAGFVIKIPFQEICELKYVVEPELKLDCIPSKEQFGRFIYLQPMSQNEESTIRAIDLVQKFPQRFMLSVQIHKYLNVR